MSLCPLLVVIEGPARRQHKPVLGQLDVLGAANDRSDLPKLLDCILFLLFDLILVEMNMAIRLEEDGDEDLDLLVLEFQIG